MKKRVFCILGFLIWSSCSSIIQQRGTSNYEPTQESPLRGKFNNFQKDLIYLYEIVNEVFPRNANKFLTNHKKQVFDSLLNAFSSVEDKRQFNLALRYYLAQFNNQHTWIGGLTYHKSFPFTLHHQHGNWYLLNSPDKSAIGSRVISINGRSMSKIEGVLFNFVSADNETAKREAIKSLINKAEILETLGLSDETGLMFIELEGGASITVSSKESIEPEPIVHHPVTRPVSDYYIMSFFKDQNFAYFQFNRCHDLIDSYETMDEYLKPWAVPLAKRYLDRQVRKKKQGKTHGYADVKRPVFKDYLSLMFDSLVGSGVENLIIDLRNNEGGSIELCKQLIYHISGKHDLKDFGNSSKSSSSNFFHSITDTESPYHIPPNRPIFSGNIYVLANQNTASAAALLTALLQDNNLATIVGTSVGNDPTGATAFQPFKLPKSKFNGSVATEFLTRPDTSRGNILIPDYWVEKSVMDIRSGHDPAFDKVLSLIKK